MKDKKVKMKQILKRGYIFIVPLIALIMLTVQVKAAPDDSDTVSLLHFDKAQPEDEVSGKTWINNGAHNALSLKKFGSSSMYFNGNNTIVAGIDSAFEFGNKDFTIDTWIYPEQLGSTCFYTKRSNSSLYRSICIIIDSSGNLILYATSNNSRWDIASNVVLASGIKAGQWNHIAVVRKGSLIKGYINGYSNGTPVETNLSIASSAEDAVHIGGDSDGYYFKGYVDEFRISKVARWTGNFTPQDKLYGSAPVQTPFPETSNLPDDSNTVSLLHFDTDGISDAVSGKVWINNKTHNTQSVKKFGNSSLYFNGNSYFVGNINSDFEFANNDFTIDMWVYPEQLNTMCFYNKRNNASTCAGIYVYTDAAGRLLFYATSNNSSWDIASNVALASGIKAGQWNHIAVVRKGSQIKGYINGYSNGTPVEISRPIASSIENLVHIGGDTNANYFNGYLDEFRVSKVARWTENFTPSSTPYEPTNTETPSDSKVKLLLELKEEKQLSVSEEIYSNADMTWTSSDTSIATLDANGKVKALKPGNTVITCKNEDGSYSETINVLVVDLTYQLAVDLKVGDKAKVTVDGLIKAAKVTWTANDTAIATVSGKGKVTAVGEGLTYVTATDENGKEIGRIYIRVRK